MSRRSVGLRRSAIANPVSPNEVTMHGLAYNSRLWTVGLGQLKPMLINVRIPYDPYLFEPSL